MKDSWRSQQVFYDGVYGKIRFRAAGRAGKDNRLQRRFLEQAQEEANATHKVK